MDFLWINPGQPGDKGRGARGMSKRFNGVAAEGIFAMDWCGAA